MILMQLCTGLLLNFFYEPFPVVAYESVQHIHKQPVTRLIRNMHHWTGHFLVVVCCLHLLRVFFSGAYVKKRRVTWYVGVVLIMLVLIANFTGYLLPWDQLSYWAVTIATSLPAYLPSIGEQIQFMLRGDAEVSAKTLKLFHVIHTTILPLLFLFFMSFHFWRIRSVGGIKLQTGANRVMVPASPELFTREFAAISLVVCATLIFSMIYNAPLMAMANPELTPNLVKAPWYFVWLQELLLHLHPIAAIITLPIAFALFLLLLPFFPLERERPTVPIKILFMGFSLVFIVLTVTGLWFRGEAMVFRLPW